MWFDYAHIEQVLECTQQLANRNTTRSSQVNNLDLSWVNLPEEINSLLTKAPSIILANTVDDLHDIACVDPQTQELTVKYTLPDGREVVEAEVVRVKNGVSANYTEAYMRRRDPNCMLIADEKPSDKTIYSEIFGEKFGKTRQETLDWLAEQDLAVFAFPLGQEDIESDAIAICPRNAAFFALGLGMLQGVTDTRTLDREFNPKTVIFVAPPFRHTHFDGKQVVVHNRSELHEIFAYNLYPGPSAKKGVYGALIHKGTDEGWVTAHCSTVQVITPYDNVITFMHEGASGGGKSEMLQQPHRMNDGRLLIGRNTITGEERFIEIPRTCELNPVCDDMGLCHPEYQKGNGKLGLRDAEDSWFMRVDHIKKYGDEPGLESITCQPKVPLLFFNIDTVKGGTSLLWEHIEDEPGVPCPNPRVVVPRHIVPNIVDKSVSVDIRSFGVRTPPCTAENPSYGIMGIMHILPPALAWLWRLVAPRGYANPSIVDTGIMSSEGVGSYWPFATGRRVDQANLLLQQFIDCPETKYILSPNQHVGAWETSFMPQWLARDYLARRGLAKFAPEQLAEARCSILGYALRKMRIEGASIRSWFLRPETQPEVGEEGYDKGAKILTDFFHDQIKKFLHPELSPLGKDIIECCLDNGSVSQYASLLDHAKN